MKNHLPALLKIYFSLASIEALACLVFGLINPADQNNTLSRWAVLALLLVTLLLCAWFTALSIVRRGRVENIAGRFISDGPAWTGRAWAAAAVFVVFWMVACLPAYRLGAYAPYFTHLQPWLVWAMLVSLQTLLVLLITSLARSGMSRAVWKSWLREEKTALITSLVVLALFLAFWLVVGVSRLGLTRDEFWDKTGVPLLNLQILAALAVSLLSVVLGSALVRRYGRPGFRPGRPWLDVVIFLIIWAVAAVAWNSTPQTHSHFAPGPYPPNYEYYPYSDAMNYDLDAQFPLIGIDQGGKGQAVDKPLYSTFLVYLHAIAGQDITSVVSLQVIALAVFPALLYLLGKALHSRAVGLFVAALAIFKEINAIRGSLIIWTVSTPKMLMSELPTAVGLALLCLLVFLWLREPRKKPVYAMAAGGVLGLLTMVRNNPWFLLPVIILIAGLAYGRQWKRWLAASGLFILVLLIAIAPWEWRNYRVRGTPFYFLTTLQTTIWENRYQPAIPTVAAPASQSSATALPGVQPTPGALPPPKDPVRQPGAGSGPFARYGAVFFFVANNFSHNLIASALTLPTAFLENDLDQVVNGQGTASLWAVGWDGSLGLEAVFLLLIELALIALGIGYCWSRWKIAGLAPLLISLAYMLALGLARTSGGRYIVPVDWVTYFYFGLGLVQAGLWARRLWQPAGAEAVAGPQLIATVQPARESQVRQGLRQWGSGLGIVLAVFLVGVSLPLSSTFFHDPFPIESKSAVLQKLTEAGFQANLGYTAQDLAKFSHMTGAYIAYGRGLFPRYLDYQADAYAKEIYNDLPKKYPHLVFEMIVPNAWFTIDLPLDKAPAFFPNAADVIVLGCKSDQYIAGLALIVLPDAQQIAQGQAPVIYQVSPAKPLSCP
jgi:hypothetical protein